MTTKKPTKKPVAAKAPSKKKAPPKRAPTKMSHLQGVMDLLTELTGLSQRRTRLSAAPDAPDTPALPEGAVDMGGGLFAMPVRMGLASIEWNSEKKTWETKMEGLGGSCSGETPCAAAENAESVIDTAFYTLEKYGADFRELQRCPSIATALMAFRADLERAHQAAHIAHAALERAKKDKNLS